MGQIVGGAAKPKRCNLNKLSQLGTPAAGEHILVSSDNSMNAAGQGHFDCYIEGDGNTAATALELKPLASNSIEQGDKNSVSGGAVYDLKNGIFGGIRNTEVSLVSSTDGKYVTHSSKNIQTSSAGMSYCVFPLNVGSTYEIHIPKAGNAACEILAYGTSASQTSGLTAVNGDVGTSAEYSAEITAEKPYLYVTYFAANGLPELSGKETIQPAFFAKGDGEELAETVNAITEVSSSQNLFDKDAMVQGYLNGTTGAFNTSTGNYWASPLIPVLPNHYYLLTGRNQTKSVVIALVNASSQRKKVLSAGTHAEYSNFYLPNSDASASQANGQFYTQTDAAYVQFNVIFTEGSGDNVMLIDLGTEYVESPIIPPYTPYGNVYGIKKDALPPNCFKTNGLSVRIFGGSVSRLCETFGGCDVMREMLGANILDDGKDGGGYCNGTTISGGQATFASNSIPNQVDLATASGQPKYDVYILWSSTNDNGQTVGSIYDYTYWDAYDVQKVTTQNGGMNYCIKKILEFSPTSRILVVGSMKAFSWGARPDTSLKELHDGQKEVASLNSLPFFSLWDNSGVNYANKDEYFTWTTENEGSERNDGTHPNRWAYTKIIAPMLARFIANFCPQK